MIGLGGYSPSNLNRKYLNGTLVIKYPDSFICFYQVVFNTSSRKVRFETAVRRPSRVITLRVSSLIQETCYAARLFDLGHNETSKSIVSYLKLLLGTF